MYNYNTKHNAIFYGRRKGRKLSKSSKLAIIVGQKYIIKREDLAVIFNSNNQIILEIGFGDGENLVNSAKKIQNFFILELTLFLTQQLNV